MTKMKLLTASYNNRKKYTYNELLMNCKCNHHIQKHILNNMCLCWLKLFFLADFKVSPTSLTHIFTTAVLMD